MIHEDISKNVVDILGRKSYAHGLAKEIMNYNGKTSHVIAINEPWGNGKSVFLDYVKSYLQEKYSQECVIIEFNPWMFKNSEDINKSFFETILITLNKKGLQEISKTLLQYSQLLKIITSTTTDINQSLYTTVKIILTALITFLSTKYCRIEMLTLIFVVGWIIYRLSVYIIDKVIELCSWYQTFQNEKSLLEIKQDVESAILDSDKKFICIIDDIDRLSREEALEVFKLIKLNANFPRFTYLLAFDETVVAKLITDSNLNGEDYVKKIVQTPLNLPKIEKESLENLLFSSLVSLTHQLSNEYDSFFQGGTSENQDLISLWVNGFPELFNNIRDVKRFLNAFEFNFSQSIYQNTAEVYLPDFIAIEAIRILNPKCYNFIRNHKEKMIYTSTPLLYSPKDSEQIKDEFKKYIEGMQLSSPQLSLLLYLFPYFNACYRTGNLTIPSTLSKAHTVPPRISEEAGFDKYFAFSNFSKMNISEYEVRNFFDLSKEDPSKFHDFLIEFNKKNQLLHLFQRVWPIVRDQGRWDVRSGKAIVGILFQTYTEIHFAQKKIFEANEEMYYVALINILLSQLSVSDRFDIINREFSENTDLTLPTLIYSKIIKEKLLTESIYLKPLQKILIDKLQSADLETILVMKNPRRVLSLYDVFSLQDERNEMLQVIWSREDLFLRFISLFIRQGWSSDQGKYTFFDKEDCVNFVDIDHARQYIQQIQQDNPSLRNEYKQLFDCFNE